MASDNFTENKDQAIDLKELIEILWAGKFRIFLISLTFAVGSIMYALSLPSQYKSTAVLAPANSDGGGLSSALGQLSGLASLAGVSLGGRETSESQVAQEIMKSWSFVENFIVDNDLAVDLYAVQGWDIDSNKLDINPSLYDTETSKWLLEHSKGQVGPPTSWQLFNKFSSLMSVSEDKTSGFVSISIEHYSPVLAKKWLDMYIDSINKHMQSRQIAKVSNNIEYLEAQIDKTSIAEMREVFYTIIEEQTKNKMVAEASPDYVFVSVSPGMIPEKKSRPNRALICVVGSFVGGLVSIFFVLLRHYGRSANKM